MTMATVGTNTNAAIQPYLNSKKVPQLFALSGAAAWDQPREFPWTMGFLPSYTAEAQIFAQYLLETHPRGRIAVLYQDDGMGKEYLKGLKDGLAGKMPIVAEATYKVSDTTIDPQLAKLKASGADVFIEFTTPKFATMAIRRIAEPAGGRCISSRRSPIHTRPSFSRRVRKMRKARCRWHTGWREKTRRGRRGGVPRVERFHAALRPEREQGQRPGRPRLSRQQDAGRGSEELRRRPVAREHHAAGPRDEGAADSDDGAGHLAQHQCAGSCAHRADADDALHQRPVAALRSGAKRHRSGHRQRSSRRSSSTAPPPSATWRTSSTPIP